MHITTERRVLRLRQYPYGSPKEVGLVRVTIQNHIRARMVGPLGEIHAFEIRLLFPGKDVADVQAAHNLPVLTRKGDRLPDLESPGQIAPYR